MYQQQPPPQWQPYPPPRRRRPVWPWLAGGIVLALLVIGGILVDRFDPPIDPAVVTAPAATPSSSPTGPRSDAQVLADDDGGISPVTDYQAALDKLKPRCTEPEHSIAAFAWFGSQDLAKHGITESALQMLGHMADSVPAGQRVNCQGILAAYLVLREKG